MGDGNSSLSRSSATVPRSEWVRTSGAFPPIITDKEFANAQRNTQIRSHNPGTPTRELLDSFAQSLANGNITSQRQRRKLFSLRRRCEQRFGTYTQGLRTHRLQAIFPRCQQLHS